MRKTVEIVLEGQTNGFIESEVFLALEQGKVSQDVYDDFLGNMLIAHVNSPKYLAFLYAISPPATSEEVRHNMLEEMGLEEAKESHPSLLIKTVKAAGFDEARISALTEKGQEQIRHSLSAPFPFPTFRDFGLSLMLEIFAFEWLFSKVATRIGDMLHTHRGIDKGDLVWFYFHAVKDIEHADEAVETLEAYADYYGVSKEDFQKIAGMTFVENIFVKRYLTGISI